MHLRRLVTMTNVLVFMLLHGAATRPTNATDQSAPAASVEIAAPWDGSIYRPASKVSAAEKSHPALEQALRLAVGPTKVWVYFTDKDVATEEEYLAAIADTAATYDSRAIERRKRRRTAPGLFDEYDLPVVSSYVDAVLHTGATLRVTSRWLDAISVEATAEQLEQIAEFTFVRSLEPVRDGDYSLPNASSDAADGDHDAHQTGGFYGFTEQQITQITLDQMHAKGFTGAGVRIGVLDTGFKRSHIAFNHPEHPLDVITEWDFFNNDPNTDVEPGDRSDQHHHGTWILATMAGYAPGTYVGGAYDASFILAKVEDVGSEYSLEEDWFAAGLEFIEANGGDVATSSLAAFWYDQSDMDGETSVMAQAFNVATANGLHCTQGAGNNGHDDNPNTAHLITPGDAFEVITVGAVDVNSNIAGFSSDGPTQDGRTKPEVLTRGQDTWTVSEVNNNTYRTQSGTSLATPLAGSVVACLVQAHPDWTVQQMRERLFTTADFYVANGTFDPLYVLGYGIVDTSAADEAGICIVHGDPAWDRNDSNTWTSFRDWAYSAYIDPKIESSNGVDHDLGLTQFDVVFSTEPYGDAGGGPVTLANVSAETTGGSPPGIASVTKNGNVLTIELSPAEFIELGEWVTFIFDLFNADGVQIAENGDLGAGVDECGRLDVGALPGDVNNNGSTQPQDLSRLIASLGADPHTMLPDGQIRAGSVEDYFDISRDELFEPLDLTRIIQALNGEGNFTQSWNGVGMNHPQP